MKQIIYPENLNVLNPLGENYPIKYHEMMFDYFKSKSRLTPFRRKTFSNLKEWKKQRAAILENFKNSLGKYPEKKCALCVQEKGTIKRSGYKIEKAIFQSRPDFWVPVNVYVPLNLKKAAAPAVICIHGHSKTGKFTASIQKCCIGLVKRGYIALALDEVGNGERTRMGHEEDGMLLPVVGETLEGYELWDLIRTIDYLCTRKDVDKEKIGCTGVSGGGNLTMEISALDERIKASVPVGAVCMYEDLFFKDSFCICECIPNIMRYADISDICALIAPRPLLILQGSRERTFPISGTREAFFKTKKIYDLYKAGQSVEMIESYLPHCYGAEQRLYMYEWFDKYLMNSGSTDIEEDLVTTEQLPATLNCFSSKKEQSKYAAQSLVSIYMNKAEQKIKLIPEIKSAGELNKFKNKTVHALKKEVFGVFPEKTPLHPVCTGIIDKDGQVIEKIIFRSEPEIVIPSLLLHPETKTRKTVVIYVSERGKSRIYDERSVQDLTDSGATVFAIDCRGTGETCYDYPDEENSIARCSIVFGRHILGMRVWDIIRAVDYIESRSEFKNWKIELAGEGTGALLCLLAGIFDRRIKKCVCDALPVTYRINGAYKLPYSMFVPGMLNYADIPQLLGMAVPLAVELKNPVDSSGIVLSVSEAKQKIAWALNAYKIAGKEKNLQVS
ncbi:MAG: hypothetical protein A2252_00135 [Elusimicrobia bacterium RIFOXYA2_FULL_39_19]|nr:MAG: hypothetical protein A2252_00135 [Elusimicrobia bacterium RIFOXYA2_FULL_39_19]